MTTALIRGQKVSITMEDTVCKSCGAVHDAMITPLFERLEGAVMYHAGSSVCRCPVCGFVYVMTHDSLHLEDGWFERVLARKKR